MDLNLNLYFINYGWAFFLDKIKKKHTVVMDEVIRSTGKRNFPKFTNETGLFDKCQAAA
jgi:hypothetical protein